MLALMDDKLADIFSTPAYDETKARKPLLNGIDKTATQFAEGKTKTPHRWWSVSNNVVSFAPKLGGEAFEIGGKLINYVPAERFPDFLKAFRAAVENGDFDTHLKAHAEGGTASTKTPRKARAASTGGGKGWSPERTAKFAATIAARNAAKDGQPK